MNNFRLVFVSRTVATGPRGSSKEDGAADSPADCKPLQSTSNGDYTGTLFTHEEISWKNTRERSPRLHPLTHSLGRNNRPNRHLSFSSHNISEPESSLTVVRLHNELSSVKLLQNVNNFSCFRILLVSLFASALLCRLLIFLRENPNRPGSLKFTWFCYGAPIHANIRLPMRLSSTIDWWVFSAEQTLNFLSINESQSAGNRIGNADHPAEIEQPEKTFDAVGSQWRCSRFYLIAHRRHGAGTGRSGESGTPSVPAFDRSLRKCFLEVSHPHYTRPRRALEPAILLTKFSE